MKPRTKFNLWRGKPTGKCKQCHNRIVKRNKKIRESIWWKVMVEYLGGKCPKCGKLLPMTPDHIIATTRKGTDSPLNIQPLCQRCNSVKGTETTDYRPDQLVRIMKVFDERRVKVL